jgi:replicative DNA helicase
MKSPYISTSNSSSATGLRLPPQHIESEQALLGAILIRTDSLYEISDALKSESFYAEKHRIIYEAMVDLQGRREPIDLLTLATKLEERAQLDSIGGRAYLAELAGMVPSSANAKYYAETVHKKHVLRNLIHTADQVSELGYKEDIPLEELLDEAESKIYSVTNISSGKGIQNIKEALVEAWARIEKIHEEHDGLRGVPTGFKDLDKMLSGLQKSDLIILAARPSVGKTTLALDIARRAAVDHNVPVGIFSLEMSSQQLIDRMLAAESSVDAWKLRTGKLSKDHEFAYLREGLDRLSKAPIFINDQAGINIMNMRSAVRRMKSEHNLGLVIVDYLQLMTPVHSTDSMVQQVTEISRSLKGLAKDLDVPVLALSQLSRAVEARGGRPRLSDLRDSGSIEQDADVVMFIHREDKANKDKVSDKPGIAEIMVEKHRNGPTGLIELFFDEKHTTFRDLDKSHNSSSQGFDDVF